METVSRALNLLRLLSQRPMGVQEVADELGVHKSTASRLLSIMQRENFLRLNGEKKYESGFAVFELAYILRESLDLRKVARASLQDMNSLTNETIHLAILEEGEVVYIDKIDSNRSIRMFSRIGKRTQPHCTGVGKAILAYLPKDELENIINNINFIKYTKNTLANSEQLLAELRKIKENGIAWDREEHENEIYCIAAPIFDFNNKVLASISISTTIKYTSVERLSSYTNNLLDAAYRISKSLGYAGNWPVSN